jgi:hypothetical protein
LLSNFKRVLVAPGPGENTKRKIKKGAVAPDNAIKGGQYNILFNN